jgi:hypothetical protein
MTAARLKAKAKAQQVDWLTLVEPRGQFLTVPVLRQAFPGGLAPVPAETRAEVRERAKALDPNDPASATAWLEWLMGDLLEWGERLKAGPAVPDQLAFTVAEHGVRLRPEYALLDRDGRARVLVERYAPCTALDARIRDDRWAASPIDRAGVLCRALAVPLALVTNGQHIALVYAPHDKVGGHATWDTALFAEGAEATLLSAFVELLGAKSFFSRGEENQLEALLARSADAQAELTTTLGLQVRRAVELVVASLSRANIEAGNEPLRGITPHRVYEAASTVVMRLVFLLYAEERHLLPLGEEVYDQNYAITTMLEELQAESDLAGDEPLELRSDAWHRILATTRAVYAGVSHDRLRMPAYHGSLFDPDRYPFLEGRTDQQPWRRHEARPIRVDDLTIREILRALQVITTREGGATEARRLSFRALDVEQIGHVYEGLLDHSALRADTVVLGLKGKAGIEPEVTLEALEQAAADNRLAEFVVEQTGRTANQVAKWLKAPLTDDLRRGLLTACDNDSALVARLEPFAHLLRDDLRGLPTVFTTGTIYVTETSHRRDTGTEYTTRELADEIVKYTLEPLVYSPGPQDGADPADWRLKSPDDILALTVCDPAVGSGAILVAACRYLAQRLVESRIERNQIPDGYVYDPSVPADEDELVVQARRDVADRCLFGVDRDPMAVEMAKLSLWLTTLSKERPFTFVDHAIQSGDSLLGITSLDQLYALHLDPERGRQINSDLFVDLNAAIKPMVDAALDARRQLEAMPATTVRDIERKAKLNAEATAGLREATIIADLIVGAALSSEGKESRYEQLLDANRDKVAAALTASGSDRLERFVELNEQARTLLDQGRPSSTPNRHPLHWPLAFPEVFANGRFDAVVGNPPFLGGQRITARMGTDARDYLIRWVADGKRGSADLVAYFFLRASMIAASFGLLATNTVAQGDTREVGLDGLLMGGSTIYRAVKSRPWPGSASLEVSEVWITNLDWAGKQLLDGSAVLAISAQLTSASRIDGLPYKLAANSGMSFQGVIPRGPGFLVRFEDFQSWCSQDHGYAEVVRPYLIGKDLNGRVDSSASRMIIFFRDWTLERAARYPLALAQVERTVKPQRQELAPDGTFKMPQPLAERWWLFEARRPGMFGALEQLSECVAIAQTSKTLQPVVVPSSQVLDQTVVVFPVPSAHALAVLLSSQLHWIWVVKYTSSMRGDTRYIPTDVFETFPLPPKWESLQSLGALFATQRIDVMRSLSLGLTALYNRVHDPEDDDPAIGALRELHREIDFAVRDAYGWTDLDLQHGFHPTPQGVRWTFSEPVQREVLDRLLELNHARHAEEVAAGVAAPVKGAKGKAAGKKKAKAVADDDQMTLEM